jgi:hypothetical protein
MKIKCAKLECEICGNLASIQIFYNKSGTIKYARARHYIGRQNSKPQFDYHQQSLAYVQRKLNQTPKSDNHQIVGQIGQEVNIDLDKTETSTILESSWASSSARIEHQPSKLRVEGSNPSPPASIQLLMLNLRFTVKAIMQSISDISATASVAQLVLFIFIFRFKLTR